MLDGMESFFQRHEHEIAALEAISTFAAVVISLALALLAQRASRTRLKATAQISIIMHSSIEGDPPSYLTVNVTNLGIMPLSIPFSFFHWKLPFKKGSWLVTPLDYAQVDEWAPQRRYPVEIKPRASESFFLAQQPAFRSRYGELFKGMPLLDRLRFYFVRAVVVTDDGKMFAAKIDKELRKELQALRSLKSFPSSKTERPTPLPR